MYQANQVTVKFSDLNDLSFIVLHAIGPWREIIQHAIPTAKFFYQEQPEASTEIIQHADFPYFSTNLSAFSSQPWPTDDRRVRLPITDESAHQIIYANYLARDLARVKPFIKALIKIWPHH